jgi:hypothetical protein
VGFSHGFFNMEFFHDAASGRVTVIEFNPRLASQMADLYLRVDGLDLYAMSLAMARGQDPAAVPRRVPTAGAASSFVYRCFQPGHEPASPTPAQQRKLMAEFADALLILMPKSGHSLDRDYTWLGSHRYGILHLGGENWQDLRERCERASTLLGWPAPYVGSPPMRIDAKASNACPAPMLLMPQTT